ncbi:uncharacterized protein A4U43_C09F16620 [Asparagus officinalis]|uniref:Uncharacterized protein n=1 Tax=Asparagus officinalis TaxID=4686 RepID=A0A5P1EB86_ASPOF|nr:uncharacterized protein A4U43_C09F16620 [Asparagus officinalis]
MPWASFQMNSMSSKHYTVVDGTLCSCDAVVVNAVDTSMVLLKKFYSGDHDMAVPFIGTQAWIRSLNYSIVDDWRSWHVDGQVAGYTRKYSHNLTFAIVKNAGHTAPEYQPKNCLIMIDRWISHESL